MLQNTTDSKAKKVAKTFGRMAADMAVGLVVQNAIWLPGTRMTSKIQDVNKRAAANTGLALGSYAVSLAAIKKTDDYIVGKMNQQSITMQDVVDEVEDLFDDVCGEMFPDEEEKEEA